MTSNSFLFILFTASLLMSAQCPPIGSQQPHCDGTIFTVKSLIVPSSDMTGPMATMSIVGDGVNLSVSSSSSKLNINLKGNETLLVSANGNDPESGIVTTEIWYSTTAWKDNSDGTVTQSGPGLLGRPSAQNPDTPKNTGDSACEARNTALTLNIADLKRGWDKLKIDIWMHTVNGKGQDAKASALLNWP